MKKINPENERMKRAYLAYLKEAGRLSEVSVDHAAAAIDRFGAYILTGARDAALASLKLRHVDLERGCIYQDAREVRTKFSKTITTFFFPIGDIFKQIFIDWVHELRAVHAWGADDPLFPATRIEVGEATGLFEARGLLRQHWSTAAPVRRIFRQAFATADLPYFNPHSLRRTLAVEGERRCRSIEELKAWSQNLGHDGVLTTLTSYGQIPIARQAELISRIGEADDVPGEAAELLQKIQKLVNGNHPSASL